MPLMILTNSGNKLPIKERELALSLAAIVRSLFRLTKSSTRNAILSNVSFRNSNVIAELLLVMTNLPSAFSPLFILLVFFSGYFDLFNTP